MKEIIIPKEIKSALDNGATLCISVSGGKDSQAMGNALVPIALKSQWDVFALHMDLGKAEWEQTDKVVEAMVKGWGIPLVVVNRPQGDLVDQIKDRMEKLKGTGKPFWPSAKMRYCTSDQKRGQADKRYRRYEVIVSAEGIRGEESVFRSRKAAVQIRKTITFKHLNGMGVSEALASREKGERVGINWYPILDWSIEEVWQAMGTDTADLERRRELYREGDETGALAGWPAHPAYVYGNERLSCALCVLACDGDIRNGAKHNPELYRIYRQMEIDGGFTFKNGRSLVDIVEGEGA